MTETLWLSEVNLSGDGQADLSVHGGVDKAVYAYPSEHLRAWSEELHEDLGPAPFGENLSTMSVLEDQVNIGDVWLWGSARLQVSQPRWPCYKLALYRGRPDIQSRLRTSGRTGWYLRVLEVGEVPAAGPIQVEAEDPARVSVRDAHPRDGRLPSPRSRSRRRGGPAPRPRRAVAAASSRSARPARLEPARDR